jgi:hypothetical protein
MNYDFLWIAYFIGTGLLTYYIFKTDILFIALAVVALELAYYLIHKTKWNFIRRYLFNLFYVVGYVTPLVFA